MFRTKKQQKTLGTCPIARTADMIGDSAILVIIRDLLSGPKRFSDLEVSLAGVSTKTLTSKLKVLEACDIVERKVFKEKPPRVEYALTKKGKELRVITEALRKYGETHL